MFPKQAPNADKAAKFLGIDVRQQSHLFDFESLDVPLKKVSLELSDVSKVGLLDLMAFLILHIRCVRRSRVRC